MKVLLPISLLAAVLAAPAFADCTAPTIAITVPDGTQATMEQMVATQHAIRDSDAAVQQFADCLKAEQDAKIAAGGDKMKDEEKVKISAQYVDRQNAVADQLQKIADQFNVAVRAYKAKAAAAAPAAAPAPAPAAKP
jgi:uncharacterized alpha/beta hydrolase family protein